MYVANSSNSVFNDRKRFTYNITVPPFKSLIRRSNKDGKETWFYWMWTKCYRMEFWDFYFWCPWLDFKLITYRFVQNYLLLIILQ